MTAFNIVRFRVKQGHEEQFIAAHRRINPGFKGFRGGALVKTGEQTFCIIGEWASFAKLANARPQMIGVLDSIRPHLEDLGGRTVSGGRTRCRGDVAVMMLLVVVKVANEEVRQGRQYKYESKHEN